MTSSSYLSLQLINKLPRFLKKHRLLFLFENVLFCSYFCLVVVLVEPYMRKGEHCCHSAVAVCWRYDGRFSLFWSSFWFLWAKVLSILMQCAGGRFITVLESIYRYTDIYDYVLSATIYSSVPQELFTQQRKSSVRCYCFLQQLTTVYSFYHIFPK